MQGAHSIIHVMRRVRTVAAGAAVVVGALSGAAAASGSAEQPVHVKLFYSTMVHFNPDSAGFYAAGRLVAEDNGRIVRTVAALPAMKPACRVLARVTLHPVPKGEREVYDRWDRAGNIRLVTPEQPDLEIVRFMTAYGGRTEHEVDVSELAPLLDWRRCCAASSRCVPSSIPGLAPAGASIAS
jgi:hypothetical protein